MVGPELTRVLLNYLESLMFNGMESDFHASGQSDDASARLAAIAEDRRRLAQRAVRPPRWFIPVSTLFGVAIVASPITASAWAVTMIAAIATIALVGLESALRKETGLTITMPVGPQSWVVSIAFGVVVLALFLTSVWFVASDLGEWIVASAAGAAILIPLGMLLLDRTMGREIQRAS